MEIDVNNLPNVELGPVGVVRSEIKTPTLHAADSGLELRERMDKMRKHQKKVRPCG